MMILFSHVHIVHSIHTVHCVPILLLQNHIVLGFESSQVVLIFIAFEVPFEVSDQIIQAAEILVMEKQSLRFHFYKFTLDFEFIADIEELQMLGNLERNSHTVRNTQVISLFILH